MQPAIPTRTPRTMAQYQRVIGTMMRHAARMQARGDIGEVGDTSLLLALALLELEPWISAPTARLYKAALVQKIKHSPTEQADNALSLLQPEQSEAVIRRDDWPDEQRKINLRDKRCAQQRATHLPPSDWRILLNALQTSNSPYGQPCISAALGCVVHNGR